MIVGTAGHIDHGKTTLVHALTGVDTDRLPEEKKRGISIELGYAFMEVDGAAERIGFIDVPGHERLVHTMLAGATGIDYALLLVAADDGVMPQTREHLAVLCLLGLSRGAAVVTKVDAVELERVHEVQAQVGALLEGTALAGAPVLPVSARSGAGVAALRALLIDAAQAGSSDADPTAAFRLAIDRAFTLAGVGTVVTGTVHAGSAGIGDELTLVPTRSATTARVRSLHAQNRPVQQAHAGQRCAIALAGLAKDDVERGQWLVSAGAALASDRLDVALTVWEGEARALRSGTPVHVHIGASATLGSVAVLDDAATALHDSLAPGAAGRVQLVLRTPAAAWHGDRVVLRDASASRTIAGGVVLDPFAPARYRRTPQRLAELDALGLATRAERRDAWLAVAPNGVNLGRLSIAEARRAGALEAQALPEGALRAVDASADWALGARGAAAGQAATLSALAAFHLRHPEELGPDAARLRRLVLPRLPEPLWRAMLARLQAEGAVAVRGAFVHLPEHAVRLSATEERIAQKAGPLLAAGGFDGVWVRDLARDTQEPEALMRTTLARLAQRGELHQVVKDLYYAQRSVEALVALARRAATGGEVNAAAFRDATRLGRKRAIQILEYFDRIGVLRRVGDVHKVRTDTALFMGP